MRLLTILSSIAILVVGFSAGATFLPDNDLNLQDRIQGFDSTTMTEAEFNQIIERVYNVMEPSVRLHGGTLNIDKLWSDSTVNAASKQTGGSWKVLMYGGLARRPEITHDGFALVMCHEMGHHLGGFPFYPFMGRWAGSEGQADYFATEVCAKKVFGSDKVENARFRADASQIVKDKCESVYKDPDQQNLCYRIAKGAESLGAMLQVLNHQENLHFETPDSSVVSKTNPSYPPKAQCRLDTYLAGLLCTAQFDLSVIPGRHQWGLQGTLADEKTAAQYACTKATGYTVGMRPACWFKDRLSN